MSAARAAGGGAPIAGTPMWQQITGRAGRRCECRGQCGRRHYVPKRGAGPLPVSDPATRCQVEAPAPLFVAPADPRVPHGEAWALPSAELAAWCGSCLDRGQAAHRAAGRAAERTASEALDADPDAGLFDLTPYRGVLTGGERR